MFYIFMLFFTIFTLYANQGSQTEVHTQPALSTTIVNVYATPTSNASSVAQNDTSTTQQQTTTNTIEVNQFTNILNDMKSSLDNAFATVPSLWTHFKQECLDHKWHIVGGSLLIGYIIMWGILIKDNFYLNQADLWSRWKYDQSLTSLCALNQATLKKELIIAIQQRYLDSQNPTNNLKPLTHFIDAIEEEKKHLETYRKRAAWLKTCCLAKILPINDNKIALVQMLIERLQFVNNLFVTWASEYNWESLS